MVANAGGLVVDLTLEGQAFFREIERSQRAIDRASDRMNAAMQSVSKGFKSAEASAEVFAKELDRQERGIRQLEGALNPAVRGLHQYEAAQEQVSRALKAGVIDQQRANSILAQAEAQWMRAGRTLGRRGFGGAIQQAGFQVGDFATQIASGGNPMVAFTQQGTQLISMFGPWGAAIGAAGAIVGALAVSFTNLGEKAKDAEELSSDLGDAISDLRSSAITGGEGLNNLIKKYGALDQQLITLIQRQTQFNLLTAKNALRDSTSGFADTAGDQFESFFTGGVDFEKGFNLVAFRKLQSELGLTATEARAAQTALIDLDRAVTLEDQVEAIGRLGGAIAETASQTDNPALIKFGSDVNNLALQVREYEEAAREAGDAQALLAKPLPELVDLANSATTAANSNRKLAEDTDAATEAFKRQAEAIKAILERVEERSDQIESQQQELQRSVDQVGNAFESAFERAIFRGEDLRGVLQGLAQDLARIASNRLFASLFDSIAGAAGGVTVAGSAFDVAGSVVPIGGLSVFNAKGNAFDRSGVITAFASGGVVNGATSFGFNGGQGLMGEAGPEAILPLERDARGRLGVIAGGGGQPIVINSNIDARGASDPAALRRALDERDRQLREDVPKIMAAEKRRTGGR